jgi:hypothetical protein
MISPPPSFTKSFHEGLPYAPLGTVCQSAGSCDFTPHHPASRGASIPASAVKQTEPSASNQTTMMVNIVLALSKQRIYLVSLSDNEFTVLQSGMKIEGFVNDRFNRDRKDIKGRIHGLHAPGYAGVLTIADDRDLHD